MAAVQILSVIIIKGKKRRILPPKECVITTEDETTKAMMIKVWLCSRLSCGLSVSVVNVFIDTTTTTLFIFDKEPLFLL